MQAHRRGDLAEAARLYRRLLQADPRAFDVLHNLGHVLVQQDQAAEAVGLFERALALRPDAASTHNMLASALRRLERHEQAIAHHRQALALRPDYPQAHHDLGRLLVGLGRADEARQAIESALAQAPRRGEYFRSLSEVVRFEAGDPSLARMEALLGEAASLPLVDQLGLHFALGKAYADIGQPARSFERYQAGCSLARRRLTYDEPASLAMYDEMATLITPQLLQAKAGLGYGAAAPIFILGMPRSGSTLIEQILAGHPDVAAGGELAVFRDAAQAALGHPSNVRSMDGTGLSALGARYAQTVRALRPRAARITDKMPGNFLFLGLIRLALPNARFIHTVRDPVDTCLSCFTTLFDSGQLYSYDLGELGRYYRRYRLLMDHWRRVLPPGVLLDVRYEDVVGDLEGQARRMLSHCGLDWDPACLDFHRRSGGVWTASAAQVRRPIYASSVGRWRPPAEVLRPLIEGLGEFAGVGAAS